MTDIDIGGMIMVIVLYTITLVFGLWAKWKRDEAIQSYAADAVRYSSQSAAILKKRESVAPRKAKEQGILMVLGASNISDVEDEEMLAGRHIGWIVGSFTMTATWVGGGYVMGTSEVVYNRKDGGLLWAQMPWASSLSLIFGGLIFASEMRDRGYVTILDPIQEQYGRVMGVFLYIPTIFGEVVIIVALFGSIGEVFAVILQIPREAGILISAVIAVAYTFFGGLYSVSFTDIIQIICVFFGLWLCVPFVLTNKDVGSIADTWYLWKGTFELNKLGLWIDYALVIILGGIMWQSYFQRVLASKTPETAELISFIAAGACFLTSIPPVLIGAAARSVKNWTVDEYEKEVHYGHSESDHLLILPLFVTDFTPKVVGWIGIAAVCAAVMSTADSFILASSSLFTRNIYKQTFRPKASSKEIYITIKVSVVSIATTATVLALKFGSVYSLYVICADLLYVIVFPNLIGSLFMPYTNAYGSLLSFVVGLFFRLAGGFLWLPPLIKYPGYSEELNEQLFPFRTFSMLMCFGTLDIGSRLSEKLFCNLPSKYDVWKCFTHESPAVGVDRGSVSASP